MDSKKPIKNERTRTPANLNATGYHFKPNSAKRLSPNVSHAPGLNETVSCRTRLQLPSSDPKFKTQPWTSYGVNCETECDIAYNDYLQALLRKQIVQKKIAEHKEILDGQILLQNENLYKRSRNLEDIVNETDMFGKQKEIIELIDFFEDSIKDLRSVYMGYDMRQVLGQFKERLDSKCDSVILKHIKPLKNQKEYDKFINILENCLTTMEKIINSGRDFEKVHTLANKIRTFIELKETVLKSQQNVARLEKEAVYSFLRNMSDFFAKQYSNEVSA